MKPTKAGVFAVLTYGAVVVGLWASPGVAAPALVFVEREEDG